MSIEIKNICKSLCDRKILANINFSVNIGEIVALIGPSGCGKTSLLRIISGLDKPDKGNIIINGQDISKQLPSKRKIGFVFQHYALFRQMTVFENISFGLKIKNKDLNLTRSQIGEKVFSLLKIMKLENISNQYPNELSGGQQQRVALARSLIIEPEILLMDEPFGALDQKVRKELRRWIRKLHAQINITTIFVTHDHEEAMELADRIVILNKGNVVQIDTASNLYNSPKNYFVYDFLGEYNMFDGFVDQAGVAHLSVSEKPSTYNNQTNYKQPEKREVWSKFFKNFFRNKKKNLPENKEYMEREKRLFARPHNMHISRLDSNFSTQAKLLFINEMSSSVKLELEKIDGTIFLVEVSKEYFIKQNFVKGENLYIHPTKIQFF